MDTLRGHFPEYDGADEHDFDDDLAEHNPPPSPIGQDERRMQVRAYNFWASMLENRNFPSIEDLEPENLPDFGPYSVLLDFTSGIEHPGIPFLGAKLAEECGTDGKIIALDEVPARSLLSRITDHYMQILANQAPIGFEAEFVNQRGATILYRGILLPFSSDDDTIDFIYGVINWKELADQRTADKLLLEIDEALEVMPKRSESPLTEWADGPLDEGRPHMPTVSDIRGGMRYTGTTVDLPEPGFSFLPAAAEDGHEGYEEDDDDAWDLPAEAIADDENSFAHDDLDEESEDEEDEDSGDRRDSSSYASLTGLTMPSGRKPLDLGHFTATYDEDEDEDDQAIGFGGAEAADPFAYAAPRPLFAPASHPVADIPLPASFEVEPVVDEAIDPDAMGLADWLASARELALAARGTEDRSRHALYGALGRAYDFALAAAEAPEDFAELIEDAGLVVQERAPLTPLVKLVFGIDYDKTRLAEYATAIGHAQRMALPRGGFADYLGSVDGGLKRVVAEERRLRRGDSAQTAAPRIQPSDAVARKLRAIDVTELDSVGVEGNEFVLLVARRMPDGSVMLVGAIDDDGPLIERAARRLLA